MMICLVGILYKHSIMNTRGLCVSENAYYKCLWAKTVACCDAIANSGASLFLLIFQIRKLSAWWPPVCFLCLATYCCFSTSKGLFKRLFILPDMGYLKKCKWDSQYHRSLGQLIVSKERWMFPSEDYKAPH